MDNQLPPDNREERAVLGQLHSCCGGTEKILHTSRAAGCSGHPFTAFNDPAQRPASIAGTHVLKHNPVTHAENFPLQPPCTCAHHTVPSLAGVHTIQHSTVQIVSPLSVSAHQATHATERHTIARWPHQRHHARFSAILINKQ